MAQIILTGTLQTSAANAFLVSNTGSGVNTTKFFNDQDTANGQTDTSSGVLEVGDVIYDSYDSGTDTYSGIFSPGSTGWWYVSAIDSAIEIEGNPVTGKVLNIVANTTTTTEATTTEATTTLATFDCTQTTVDLSAISGGRTGATIDTNLISVSAGTFASITPTTIQSGDFDYDVAITVPAGYDNSAQTITCQATATGVDKAIAFNSSGQITFDSTQSSANKQFTIDSANEEIFDASTDVGLSASVGWISFSASGLSLTGGNLIINVEANTGTASRQVDITLLHPEDGGVQSPTSVTIVQSGADAIPVAGDYSITMTNQGDAQNPDSVDLNFDAAQGGGSWAGNPVTDAEDSFDADTLTIEIVSLPGNGTISDVNGSGNLSVGSQLQNTNGEPTLRYTPNTAYTIGGTDQFQYKAVDSAGQSDTGLISITVNGPANVGPTLQDFSRTLPGYGSNRSATWNLDIYASDDSDAPSQLTYYWSATAIANNGGVEITPGATLQLNNGTLTADSADASQLTYTYTGPTTTPNTNPLPTDNFYWTAKDTDNQYSSAARTGSFTITKPGNTPPQLTQSSETINLAQYASDSGNVAQYASDAEGDTLSYALVSQSGSGNFSINSNTGSWTYSSGTWAITPGQTVQDVVVIGVSDGYQDGTPQYTITFNVTGVSYIEVFYSLNASTSDNACTSTQDNLGYLNIDQATNLDELAVGDSIYSDEGFLSPVLGTGVAPWVSVREGANSKALQIDEQGVIQSIINCAVASGEAWPLTVNYAIDPDDLCYGTSENSQVWQNVLDPATAGTVTLLDVVNAGGQLFTNEYYANQYDGSVAPSGVTVPVGFYNDSSINPNQYFEWLGTAWNSSGIGQCDDPITYETYSLEAYYSVTNRTDINAACLSDENQLTGATLWFRADITAGLDTFDDLQKLEYVMRNQLVVFTSQAGAQSIDYDLMWDSTVFIATPTIQGKFAKWENDNSSGYTGNYNWYGVNENNLDQIEAAVATTKLGECGANFTQPVISSNFSLGLTGTNIFYAFLECSAKFEGGEPYWNMYVIDGLHTNDINSTSYIKEFVDLHNETAVKIGGDTLIGCLTLSHKIQAVNIEGAVNSILGEAEYNGTSIRPIAINPVDLGFTSGATIGYSYLDCGDCLAGQTAPETFTLDVVDEAEIINRSVPNFDLETNYKLDNVSKPLLRTNPKLSTNAKLVTNSQGKMFIESIDATKDLASVEYKKWSVNKDGQWAYDLPKFFKSSKTPSDQIYLAKSAFSDFTVQESFDKQIEEDYHYGTTYNYSKLHDEDFRMMAPIWLDKNIPSKFVIFKVTDPSALDFDTNSNYDNMSAILQNSEIIETFDLTRKSELGTYIRNHVQSELFPKNPITANFDKNEKTSFNGIDIKKGGFTSKGEYLYEDFVKQDQTLIEENDLITGGFERNGIVCANIMNLEFLFNDPTADIYGVNRYFGLYVDDVDSGYGSLQSANNGALKFKFLNSGINEDSSSAIPPFSLIKNTPTLGYAHVVNSGNFYKISPKSFYDTSKLEVLVEDSINSIASEVKLAPTGKSIDAKSTAETGSDFIKINVVDNPAVNDRFGIFPSKEQLYRIKFARYKQGDTFSIRTRYSSTPFNITLGATISNAAFIINQVVQSASGGNLSCIQESEDSLIISETLGTLQPLELSITGDASNTALARVEELQVPYDLSNNMFFGTDGLPAGHYSSTSFSNQGTPAEIASAITKAINATDNGFTALTYDGAEYFYIKTDVVGYRLLGAGINVPNDNANNFLSIDDKFKDVDNLLRLNMDPTQNNIIANSTIYYFNGGHAANKSVLVTLDSVQDIGVGDFIETRSSGVYNRVLDIVDDIERLPLQYNKLILERVNTLEDGEIKVFADGLVKLGLFSAYDIHDMNFDFYDKSNSDLKELQYETAELISYEPETDDSSDIYPFGDRDNTEYLTTPASYFTGLNDILREERADEFDETIIESEYDRLEENSLKEFATVSRVVPTINKWVLKDTVTVREQPYYLNANEAFGRSNFAADMSVGGRDRLGMTHEWFYVNNLPKHLIANQGDNTNPAFTRLNDSFSYINFMEGFEITPDLFKNVEFDYFDRFFVTEGFETKGDNNYKTFVKTNRQKKYTLVDNGNDMSFADTIFKGIKVTFKNRKEFTASSPVDFIKSPEFNGYKFSILLNVKTAQESNGIEYEVIQNKKFKFCVFFISLSLDDLWADQTLTKKLLYELNHSLVWDNENNTFRYSDIKIDGCFDLNSLNQDNPASPDYLQLSGLQHQDGSMPQYLEQINKNDDDEYGKIIVRLSTAFGEQYLQVQIEKIEGQDLLKLAGPILDITNGETNAPTVDLESLPGYLQWNAEYTYVQGGINAYKFILDALGIQNMATMLLREPGNIKYTTINTDGTSENNKFIILFEDGVEFIKESSLITVPDTDKPESFKLFSGNIGFDLTNGFTYYPFLIRHNGGYTIDTRPVVTFTDVYAHMKTNTLQSTANTGELTLEEQMYKHSLSNIEEINLARDYYKKYNRCGVAFNLGFIFDGGENDTNWGKIKNHFYRKVNEFNAAGVTKLSTSTDKLPLYPLIGEVAIDKKDVHVFRSSWDKNYYTRSISGGGTELVPGTFETKEEKSYLASTIMQVADNYTLLDFNTQLVTTEEEQDDILLNNTNSSDIVMFEDDDRVVLDFYIDYTIGKRLSSDGVLSAITKYVLPADSAEDKTTLEDDAKLYINENLVNVFGVSQIKLYTKRIKGEPSALESVSNVDELDNGGYIVDQSFSFKAHEQKPLNFRLIYNKRLGYSYRIRPMVKITS